MFEFRIQADGSAKNKIEEGLIICEALTMLNEIWLRDNPHFICALEQGLVAYDKASELKRSSWQKLRTGPILIEDGKALCMEIVAFECAARRLVGQQAYAHIFEKAPGLYHVRMIVIDEYGNEHEEDPSLELEKKGKVITPGCSNK